jgi:uncharacterized protein YqgC (DUF456 family)
LKRVAAFVPVDAPAALPDLGNWWHQAITGPDNHALEPSMLAAMVGVFVMLPLVILLLCGIAGIDVVLNKHEASVGALGAGIAAVLAAMGAYIASLVLMLRQDRVTSAIVSTTETSSTSKTKTTTP